MTTAVQIIALDDLCLKLAHRVLEFAEGALAESTEYRAPLHPIEIADPIPVYHRHMAFIVVSASAGDVFFSCQHSEGIAECLIPSRLAGIMGSLANTSNEVIKEVVNLVGGRTKGLFEQFVPAAGMSLPFAVDGFDNYFLEVSGSGTLPGIVAAAERTFSWRIPLSRQHDVVFSVSINMRDRSVLENLARKRSEPPDQSWLEILG